MQARAGANREIGVPLDTLLGVSGGPASGAVCWPTIQGLQVDSRKVQPGDLFVALPGTHADGRAFIPQALAQGALAVLSTEDARQRAEGAVFVADSEPRRRYAEMAAIYHGGLDGQPATRVAVTGTNGKTSVADFTRQIWAHEGEAAASYGTLGLRSDVLTVDGGLTTPDPMAFYGTLRDAAAAGVTHLALEASSHGLDQYRLDGTRFDAAAFTNLTRDHLDYHGTFEAYYDAKARLFRDLVKDHGGAAIHADDPFGDRLALMCSGIGLNVMRIGSGQGADIEIREHELSATGQTVRVAIHDTLYDCHLPLIGDFQGHNALTALALAHLSGMDVADGVAALAGLTGVPGRMEFCGRSPAGGSVYIDYAHTPAGLETALKAARAHRPAVLSVVFGCGGDRDRGKRPQMGQIASDLAGRVYVTDDNPRSEVAATIRSEILAATSGARDIGDRAAAIEAAIADLGAGEILIIAGKGHEEGQVVGDQVLPFSDLAVVRSVLDGGSAS